MPFLAHVEHDVEGIMPEKQALLMSTLNSQEPEGQGPELDGPFPILAGLQLGRSGS